MIRFWNNFTKITAWPAQKLVFRTRVYYEDKEVQSRRIRGAAILVSNHTSVFDYAVYLFVFFTRTLRFQMAEVLFKKKILCAYLRCMGGIYLDRFARGGGYLDESERILRRGGVVGIFPEGRLPLPNETPPLAFKPGAVILALRTGAPIIPLYTHGAYFTKKRAAVVIGKPICADRLYDETLSEKENVRRITETVRQRIVDLEKLPDEKQKPKTE